MNPMDNAQPRIKQRLLKILELARRGEGGERVNAQRMLDNLLKKHGLTIDELEREIDERTFYEFTYKGEFEKRLLNQCVYAFVPKWDGRVFSKPANKNVCAYRLTKAEFVEVELYFSIHRESLKVHMKRMAESAFNAYVQTNDLFCVNSESEDVLPKSNPPMSSEEVQAIVGIMGAMRPTQVHKAISN